MADAGLRPFTRARIARACADVLRRSGVLGVLPTPLAAVQEVAGVRGRVEIGGLPAIGQDVRGRLLGASWFEERVVFVDERQSAPRRRFTEAHEIVHLLCPWHAGVLRLDTAAELFGELSRGIEAEANFGAGELLFQGTTFRDEASPHDRSLRTPFALASRFGASRHAAAHRYVQDHSEPVALAVAGRWPAPDGCLPVWRSVESPSFLHRHGPLPLALPGGKLETRDGPLASAIAAARRSSEPVAADIVLNGRRFHAEVAYNRHCHLVFVAERSGVAARPCDVMCKVARHS
jgi:uncharacterized protein DUF955